MDGFYASQCSQHSALLRLGGARVFEHFVALSFPAPRASPHPSSLQVLFGPVASGDEDVVEPERRQEIQNRTGALVVAWEGAGEARACQFSSVPFLEIRGVTDSAGGTAAADFALNKVAILITSWMSNLRGGGEAG